MYMIMFYVPSDAADNVKHAMFTAGAGKIGAYSHCCWQVQGQGQFMPLLGSHPAIGTTLQLEKVVEYKVEMTCEAACIHAVIAALKAAHPYEEPAYQVLKLETF